MIAAAEPGQVGIGVLEQLLQVVGLGDTPEDLAVGGADQLADASPAAVFAAGGLQFVLGGLLALEPALVVTQGEGRFIPSPLGRLQPGAQFGPGLVEGRAALLQCPGDRLIQQRLIILVLGQRLAPAVAQQGVAPLGQGGGGALALLVACLDPPFRLPGRVLGLAQQPRQGVIIQPRVGAAPLVELLRQALLLLASLLQLSGLMLRQLGQALVLSLGVVQVRQGVVACLAGALLARLEPLVPGVG